MERTSSIGTLPPGLEDAQLVAHGGFASVYRAWQPHFHRQVAVKVLAADAGDPDVRARFEREVRAMGALSDHPHVVPVYDAGITDDRPYLVMPYLAGGSLDGAGPLDADEVTRIGIAVADALDAAHRTGLLHRDVKPANILRTERGEPKLADFGVARFADATATHGQLAMTLAYAAPEMLRGDRASPMSDVYSLGATLHALLRGSPPFAVAADSSPMAMAMKVVSDDPPDLRAAGAPAGLAAVVERAMAKDPAERYPTAAAMREALEALGDEGPATIVTPAVDRTAIVPPAPAPAPAPAPMPTAAPTRRQAHTGPARRVPWLPIALVALVVLGVLAAAYVAATGDDDDGDALDTATSSTTVPAEVSSTTAAPPSTTATTAASTTTTTAAVAAPASDVVDAARDYFAVLDAGDIDGGWARLSPRYQDASGRDSYYGFWETIESVEVLDAQPAGDDSATLQLRYTRDDGSTTTETNTLRFVEGDDGELLIDGSS